MIGSSIYTYYNFECALRAARMRHIRPQMYYGNKVILPPSVLERVAKIEASYPLTFEIRSEANDVRLHCGPIEWVAEEGRIYIPDGMMDNMGLVDGSLVVIRLTEIPRGEFVKFKPKTIEFLHEISNPRAVLEKELRVYAALTVGEVIYFRYNEQDFYLEVIEVRPTSHGAISIIEADIVVDFEPPDGYVSPDLARPAPQKWEYKAEDLHELEIADGDDEEESRGPTVFSGPGYCVSGRFEPSRNFLVQVTGKKESAPSPDKQSSKTVEDKKESPNSKFSPFCGQGFRLRD
ncbi:uncharacterized protein LOC126326534 [Schistocerca gregaria]|uniref:uncharacterized protein LOC126326534 n=1 Tax=Schistocerca gregaria TaxID=7010 RepID=UPI00211ED61C|nr:uncharacterized protein LOC126326534 [Schistocerca gregaria]